MTRARLAQYMPVVWRVNWSESSKFTGACMASHATLNNTARQAGLYALNLHTGNRNLSRPLRYPVARGL